MVKKIKIKQNRKWKKWNNINKTTITSTKNSNKKQNKATLYKKIKLKYILDHCCQNNNHIGVSNKGLFDSSHIYEDESGIWMNNQDESEIDRDRIITLDITSVRLKNFLRICFIWFFKHIYLHVCTCSNILKVVESVFITNRTHHFYWRCR